MQRRYDPGIDLLEVFIAETVLLVGAGTEVLAENIGIPHEFKEDFPIGTALKPRRINITVEL